MAGGFSRGTADTDILYEDGEFAIRSGVSYVAPQRGYETVTIGGTSVAGTDSDYTDAYTVPSFAMKLNLTEDLRCAGTYTQPFGADTTYGDQAIQAGIAAEFADGALNPSGTAYTHFSTDELGLTCGYRFQAGPGNIWILGGGFLESISYEEGSRIGAPNGPIGALSLTEDGVPGYRLGLAYEIPEIALRVQGIYRSQVEHDLTGTFSITGLGVVNPAAIGSATMPQSFELKAQTGIAPSWLAFGSVKWTDWSVLQTLKYTTLPLSNNEKDFFYEDGWTVSGGIGHQFTDALSGSVSLTWDKGVATTEDVNEDIFTLATGIALSGETGGQLRIGGAISYLQGGSVTQAATCDGGGDDCGSGEGGTFAYTVGDDWSFALGASFNVKF